MGEILASVQGAAIISCVDAHSGFYSVPIIAEHKERVTLASPWGSYQFRVLPQGMANSPSAFQRTMDTILFNDSPAGPSLIQCVRVYIDGIVIFSHSVEDHNLHLH